MRKFKLLLFVLVTCFLSSLKLSAQIAYITNSGDSTVSVIDTKTNTVVTTIHTPYASPWGVVVSQDGSKAFITYSSNSNISVINTNTNIIVNNFNLNFSSVGFPLIIDISPDGSKLYCNQASVGFDTVLVVNTLTGNIIAKIDLPDNGTSGHNSGIVVSPDGAKVYVSRYSDIIVINTTNNIISTIIPIDAAASSGGIAISPDGSKVYVTESGQDSIKVINTSTNTVSGSISDIGGANPTGIVVSSDGSKIYVVNPSQNKVAVINAITNTVTNIIAVGNSPNGIAITPDGSLLYVANGGSNTVSVINTSSDSVVATVPVGSGPVALGKFIANVPATPPPPVLVPPGNALNFDGIDDYVSIPHNSLFKPTSQITLEAWVHPTDIQTNRYYEICRKDDPDIQVFSFQEFGTVLSFGLNINGVYSELDVPISAAGYEGQWVHVAATFDGTVKKVYRNGVLIGSQNQPGLMGTNGTSPFYIGASRVYGEYFKGDIDEVSIWDTALTQSQIQSGMLLPIDSSATGLAAYYNFDNGIAGGNNTPDTVLQDKTIHSFNGALHNFTLNGNSSSWVESYATVVPISLPASHLSNSGFTANWNPPLNGIVDNYLLDVSTNSSFNSFFPGYNALNVGAVTSFNISGLRPNSAYYYRIRANKSSVNNQGGYSATIQVNLPVNLSAQNAYITNSGDSTVSVIDTKTNTLVTTIHTPITSPNGVVVSHDGSKAFITYSSINHFISVINTSTNTILNNFTIGLGGFGGDGIDVSADGSTLYYAGSPDTVFVVNSTTPGNVITKIFLPGVLFGGEGGIEGIVLSPDGTKVFVAASNGSVYVINASTNTISATINTGPIGLHGIDISPDGSKVYTASTNDSVYVISTSANAVIGSILTGTGNFGASPFGIVVSHDGLRAYVTNQSLNNVAVINTATNTLIDSITVGNSPHGIALTSDDSLLYVANQGSNTVSVINTSTNSVVTTIPVGNTPLAFGKFIGGTSNVPLPPPAVTKLDIKSFAIFAGDSTASLTDSVHYGVEIATSVSGNISIENGLIGSTSFVQFTKANGQLSSSPTTVNGNVYGNVINAPSGLVVNGTISVLNTNAANYNVLRIDSLAKLTSPGNIFVNGNAFLGSNSNVTGKVQIPGQYTYVGPPPGAGIDSTTPVFPQMPDLPPVSNYNVPTGPNITGTQTILPGSYGNIILNGGDSLIFSGVGTYVFAGVNNTNFNNIIFDFKNNTTGAFQIIFTQDVNMGNLWTSIINGGSAGRIFTEAKGKGTQANNFTAFAINTSSIPTQQLSFWYGTVYAPYAAIAAGNSYNKGFTSITGCLWSSTKVTLGLDAYVTYAPPAMASQVLPLTDIIPYYPAPGNGKVNTPLGSELTSLYENPIPTDSIIYRIFGNQVMIDVILQSGQYAQTLSFLQANGLNSTINNGQGSLIITGLFPIANLLALNTRPDLINYVRPLYFPLNNSGIVQTQGDTSIQSNFVRKGYNLTGQGVKVGVLSDSYNTIPGDYAGIDIANGDLPGTGNPYNHLTPVQVLTEYPFGQSVDEGRAMLEILHDIVPDATLAFRTGFTTPGDFAMGIGELKAAGCDVIVDDITFITEPYFKDGVVAHAVDNAVAAGATYFSAAGNFGMKSYEGNFSGMTAPASLPGITAPVHDFGSGNALQTLHLQPGNYTIVLQWDDNIYSMGANPSGASTDLDIYLADNSGNLLFGFNRNNIGSDPLEVLPFTVNVATTANLVIAKAGGPDVHFKYIVFRGLIDSIKGYTGSSTLVGQANSAGAIAVGAAFYRNTPPYNINPPTISSFSSVGGTIVEGTVRNKPDIVAPQGINTTVDFGAVDYEPDNFANFFGTSASAPHAAAAAVQLIEGQRKFLGHTSTPDEIRTLINTTALDMNTPGYDPVTGYGFIQPMAAMQTFAAPKPIIIGLVTPAPVIRPVTAAFTVTVRGRFLNPQTVVYLRGVPIATNYMSADSVSAVIPPFTDNPVVQLYNPPITSSSLDGGLSDSLYFFPKKHIIVKANNQTKKYGEVLPAFSSTITIDGVPISKTGLTTDDLKLNPILYTTPATSSSNIASYFIHPYNILDPHDPTDSLLLDTYSYEFIDGLLTVTKLPIKITPRDTSLVYGQQIHGIGFNYTIDSSVTIQNEDSLIGTIQLSHTSAILDSIFVLANRGAISRPLVNSDLDSLGILISNGSGAKSRPLVNNGSGTSFTSYVVDIDNQSVFNYEANPASSPLVNTLGTKSRALVNTGPLINGIATVIVNGAGAKSRPLVNGDPLLLNSTTTSTDSISNIAVVISDADVPSATTNRIFTQPANLITGITVGQHIIAPAAFISGNFDVSYSTGSLTITPAPLTITADTAYSTNGQLPTFTATVKGFQYQDSTDSPIQGPQFTLLPAYTGNPGVYTIRPSSLSFAADTNYTKLYIDGVLYVSSTEQHLKPIVIRLKCVERLGADNPTGYRYVAHFSYENRNSVAVNIPIGVNNKITSARPYKGIQPSEFKPGLNYVDYYFNGDLLTWRVRTSVGVKNRILSEASASSSSPKCNERTESFTQETSSTDKEAILSEDKLYPNPATNTLWVVSNNLTSDEKNITVVSALGAVYHPVIKNKGAHTIEIDISGFQKGVYFIRIKNKEGFKTLSFIKL